MKNFAAVMVMALFTVFMAMPALAAPELTLRFAGQLPSDHLGTKIMQDMAKEIETNTKGRIAVKVFPANQLGDFTLVYEELIRGTIDMSITSVPSQFDPRLEVTYTNCFVRDYKDAYKVFASDGWLFKKMDSLNNALGVKFLGFYTEGFIGISSSKPLKDPLNPKVDKGVLARVPAMEVYKSGAEAMGFRTVTIPWADTYQAMQTGVCDAVVGMAPASAYTILKDVIKHFYVTNYSMENFSIMMSMKTWGKMKPADQKIVAAAASKAAKKSIDAAQSEDKKYLDIMRKAGIKVYTYKPEELKPLFVSVYNTWDKLGERFTKEMMADFKKQFAPK